MVRFSDFITTYARIMPKMVNTVDRAKTVPYTYALGSSAFLDFMTNIMLRMKKICGPDYKSRQPQFRNSGLDQRPHNPTRKNLPPLITAAFACLSPWFLSAAAVAVCWSAIHTAITSILEFIKLYRGLDRAINRYLNTDSSVSEAWFMPSLESFDFPYFRFWKVA